MTSAVPSSRGAAWQLRIDGHPRLMAADGSEIRLGRHDGVMLAYLAHEGPTAREKLLSLLWPDEPLPALRGRLRQRVFALKRKLGTEPVEGATILSLGAGIGWAGLAIGPDDRAPLTDENLHGLPDLGEWLAVLRDRQQTLQRDRLAEQISLLEREGQWAQALVLADRLVALSPLHEHAHRRRMRLHYLRGDRAAALAAFDQCERVLKDEVGTRPSAETLALLGQIESSTTLTDAAQRAAVPVTVLRPPRLIGREPEWRRLQAAWQALHAVVVIGEAGLGKSRLLSDMASAHGLARGKVVMVSARPGDERVSYAVLGRLLRALLKREGHIAPAAWVAAELARLLPELGAAMVPDAETSPARLASAVEHLVVQARDTGLDAVILDDLHFCDTATLEVAQLLAAASTGVRWLVAMRPSEVAPAVQAYVDELVGSSRAETLVLQALNVAQIAELLDTLQIPGIDGTALAVPLRQRTGGNVLYLLETLKALLQRAGPDGAATDALARLPIAPNVGRLIEQRVNRLSPAAVRLVRCAAVAGSDFSAALASQVLGVRPLDLSDAWAELEAAQMLSDGAFAHDLIFECVLATVPPVIAEAFHGEVAAWLDSQQADPTRIAHHRQQARQWLPAVAAWTQAAASAARQGRHADQAGCLALAAGCFGEASDPDRRVQALLDRAAVLVQYEVGEQALSALADAERELRTDRHRLALLNLRMALANLRSEFDTTLALAPGALALAETLGDDVAVFETTMQWCGPLTKCYRASEALALFAKLRPWVEAQASPGQKYEFWNGLALALDFDNRLAASLQASQASFDVAQAMDSQLLPQALNNMGYTCAKMGQLERAADFARRVLTLSRSRADDFDTTGLGPVIRLALGHHLRNLGCYREAIGLMEEALQGFEAGGSAMLVAPVQNQLALTWVQLGQPGRAQSLVSADLPDQNPVPQAQRLAFRALVLHALGRPGLDEIRQALALVPNPDSLAHRMWTLVATALVPPPEGEGLAVSLAAWASERERLGLALAAHGRAARCAYAQGDWQRAVPQVEAAMRLAREVKPDIYYLPELWWTAVQVYEAAGRGDERRAILRDSAEWVMRIAREQVPDPFRNTFLQRNPFNAQLLRWAEVPALRS